jgi:tRNA A37 threonylcarbamoyladenosine modification protein TsaB
VPVAGVSTLYAFGGGQPVIDARRGEVFTEGPALARPEELDVAGRRLVGDGAVRYRDLFAAAGADVPPDGDRVHVPSARLLIEHAGSFGPAERLQPLYLRDPDARPSR